MMSLQSQAPRLELSPDPPNHSVTLVQAEATIWGGGEDGSRLGLGFGLGLVGASYG